MFQNVGELLSLFWRTVQALPLTCRQRQKVYDQLFEIGNASLLMACILSLFIGGVIALQTGPPLPQRGLSGYVGGIVGNAICQELGPGVMFILIPRRVGAALGGGDGAKCGDRGGAGWGRGEDFGGAALFYKK